MRNEFEEFLDGVKGVAGIVVGTRLVWGLGSLLFSAIKRFDASTEKVRSETAQKNRLEIREDE